MPAKNKEPDVQPHMTALVGAVIKKDGLVRNVLNAAEVTEKLAAIGEERLRDTDADRAEKGRQWLGGVARKWLLREGEADEVGAAGESSAELAALPKWAQESLALGLPVIRVVVSEKEIARIEHVVDWLRADNGPSLASDWSRISFAQAEKGVESWIADNARAAERRLAEMKDIDVDAQGVRTVMELQGGWRWVQVLSPDSLNREGALMRHCAGSYAKQVAVGDVKIWSLRDKNNQPRLTIESVGKELKQLKAFANGVMDEEHGERVGRFIRHLPQELAGFGVQAESMEMVGRDWEAAGFFMAQGSVFHGTEITEKQLTSFLGAVDGRKEDLGGWRLPDPAQAKEGWKKENQAAENILSLLKGMARKLGVESADGEFPESLERFQTLLPKETPSAEAWRLFPVDEKIRAYQAGAINGAWLGGVLSQRRPEVAAKAQDDAIKLSDGHAQEKLFSMLCVALRQTHKNIPAVKNLYDKAVEIGSRGLLSPDFLQMMERKELLPMRQAFDKQRGAWISESAENGFGYRGGDIARFAEKFDFPPESMGLLLANRKKEQIRELSAAGSSMSGKENTEKDAKKALLREERIRKSQKKESQQLMIWTKILCEKLVAGRKTTPNSVERVEILISFLASEPGGQKPDEKKKKSLEAFARVFSPKMLEKVGLIFEGDGVEEAKTGSAAAPEQESESAQLRGVEDWRRENGDRKATVPGQNTPSSQEAGLTPFF